MKKPNSNNPFEAGMNEMTKTCQSQFSAWLKMSEDYFDFMNDNCKKMVSGFQTQYGLENEVSKDVSKKSDIKANKASKEKAKEPDKVLNADIFDGNWKQLMDDVQKQWGKLTNDNLSQINGSRKKLAGAIQENYGVACEEAEKQMKDWEKARTKMLKTATN